MKKISKEKVEALTMGITGTSAHTLAPIAAKLCELEIGEGLSLTRDEWPHKDGRPDTHRLTVAVQKNCDKVMRFGVRTLEDGWLVFRKPEEPLRPLFKKV